MYEYNELLKKALETNSFEDKDALAYWLGCNDPLSWNGEVYDISDVNSPSGTRVLRPVYDEETMETIDFEVI